jgi:hypothetical protein
VCRKFRVEACACRHVRILPGLAQGPFDPSQPEPEIYFQICYLYRTEAQIFLFYSENSPKYVHSALTIMSLTIRIIQQALNELLN